MSIVNVSTELILYNDGFCPFRIVPLTKACAFQDSGLVMALFHHHPVKMAVSSKELAAVASDSNYFVVVAFSAY